MSKTSKQAPNVIGRARGPRGFGGVKDCVPLPLQQIPFRDFSVQSTTLLII